MKILLLGGTRFLGRHLVESALARGHQPTLFTRGQSNPALYPDLEQLRGDRDGQLQALEGRCWDAVIDTSGYVPRVVRASARLLAGGCDHYTFISTISVYSDVSQPGISEDWPVGTLDDDTVEDYNGPNYGPLKALCERAVEEELPGRALLIRPGLIVGPHDPTDRFTYWPVRVAAGGEVLAPSRPDRPVQFIDARDLADWTIRLAEARQTGTFNATGPATPLTMGEVVETCRAVGGGNSAVTWVPDQFLLDHEVRPWTDLPLWVPDTPEWAGFMTVDVSRALEAGLTFRPLIETVADTLAWAAARPDGEARAGVSRERERAVLRAWAEHDSPNRPE